MRALATDPKDASASRPAPGIDWPRVRRQVAAVLRLELRQQLRSRRSLALYLLAFAPVALFLVWAASPLPRRTMESLMEAGPMFAHFFEGYLRTSVFLGTLILFMSLFRSEILQRSLHYYLLTPVRREVLVVGKYLSALLASGLVFALSTGLLYCLVFLPWGPEAFARHLFQGPGLGHLLAYCGIAVLACTGYGAVFLLAGLFLRNPVIAAALIWGWEFINFLLPAALKKVSVIYYLQSLYPVPNKNEAFQTLADPISPWLAVPGLLLFTAALLVVACRRARTLEINYGGD